MIIMTILHELKVTSVNPIGMFSKDTVLLYWENYQIQRTRTDLLNLWLNN
jgi:hypothetical protein